MGNPVRVQISPRAPSWVLFLFGRGPEVLGSDAGVLFLFGRGPEVLGSDAGVLFLFGRGPEVLGSDAGVPFLFGRGPEVFSRAVFAAGSIRSWLGDQPDEADAEAVLGAHFVLRAAMRAANVRPAGILSPVKNLHRPEQLRAAKALHGRVADQLLRLGHLRFSSSDTRRADRFRAPGSQGAIVRSDRCYVQSRAR